MKQFREQVNSNRPSAASLVIGILLLGSIWGLLDALSGAALFLRAGPLLRAHHLCVCPLTAAVFGFFIMALASSVYRSAAMPIGIGAVAALFKLLNFVLLPTPVIDGHVTYQPLVNPALAALAAALVLAPAAAHAPTRHDTGLRAAAGLSAGFLSAIAFVFAASYLTRTPPLVAGTPWQFLFPVHGPATAILGAVFFPLGHRAGMKLREGAVLPLATSRRFCYVGAGITALCLAVSAVALLAISPAPPAWMSFIQ